MIDQELLDRYRHDRLTPAELQELRKQLGATDDGQLSAILQQMWESGDDFSASADPAAVERIRRRVEENARQRGFFVLRVLRVAAGIMLPVLLATTFYFYRESRAVLDTATEFATAAGERATITLPDGTRVTLNECSRLDYRPAEFNRYRRDLRFEGEAYFRVAKNADVPLRIAGHELSATVRGTVFNLLARNSEATAVLALEEGRVELEAAKSGQRVALTPGQRATLCYCTGSISVASDTAPGDASAWQRRQMVFRHRHLSDVIKEVSRTYRVSVALAGRSPSNADTFSGTLPTDNLDEALGILRQTYRLNISRNGKRITLSLP